MEIGKSVHQQNQVVGGTEVAGEMGDELSRSFYDRFRALGSWLGVCCKKLHNVAICMKRCLKTASGFWSSRHTYFSLGHF